MSGLNYLFVGADNPEAFMIGNDEVEVVHGSGCCNSIPSFGMDVAQNQLIGK